MDRLLHHAHVLTIEGDSYRNPTTNQRTRSRGERATETKEARA